ncbi:MAG: hypothetical protein IJ563_03920 [Selenomonadaceae bacterium]|nr:hypothetical protein [Selenomonadaceae bacterium]
MFKFIYSITDKIKNKLNEKGQGMVEYAIILAGIALIAASVFLSDGTKTVDGETVNDTSTLKGAVNNAFENTTKQINKANPAS